uniref:Uncharacterized protein n=1 Tax=Rhizophora mucronata TaxID=61149 RepID=A0A2P2PE23_RHIMU
MNAFLRRLCFSSSSILNRATRFMNFANLNRKQLHSKHVFHFLIGKTHFLIDLGLLVFHHSFTFDGE